VTATLNPLAEPVTRVAPAIVPELDPVFAGAELTPNRTGNGTDGLLVTAVEPGSRAGERGLREGDMITAINQRRVRSLDEARQTSADARTVILQVQRGGRSLLILLRP
jgi:S1-C subfamily serine protease